MKSSQIIIFYWIYTVTLMNAFFYLVIDHNVWTIIVWKVSIFWMLLMLPMFIRFAFDDIEDEYRNMWRQLQMNGYIR